LDASFFYAFAETRLDRTMSLSDIFKSDSRRVSEFCPVFNYLESESIIKILESIYSIEFLSIIRLLAPKAASGIIYLIN
jgi:hypothetical protein